MLSSFHVDAVDWQLGGEIEYAEIDIAGEEYHPMLAKWVVDAHLGMGFGVEAHYAVGVLDDTVANVAMEVSDYGALYASYRGYLYDSLILEILYGRAEINLDSNLNNSGFPGGLRFRSDSYGISLQERLSINQNVIVSAGYRQLFKDENMRARVLSFGVNYAF